jgi:hypothetical protein
VILEVSLDLAVLAVVVVVAVVVVAVVADKIMGSTAEKQICYIPLSVCNIDLVSWVSPSGFFYQQIRHSIKCFVIQNLIFAVNL